MESPVKRMRWLRILLIVLPILAIGIIVYISNIQRKQHIKLDKSLNGISAVIAPENILGELAVIFDEVESSFRLYLISDRKENYELYNSKLKQFVAISDSMATILSGDTSKLSPLLKGLSKRKDLMTGIQKLKVQSDSLMELAISIDSLRYQATLKAKPILVPFVIPSNLVIDTLSITETTKKEKKGLFGRIKNALTGSSEEESKKTKIIVKTGGQDDSTASKQAALGINEFTDSLSRNMQRYYTHLLSQFVNAKKKMDKQEQTLALVNLNVLARMKSMINQFSQMSAEEKLAKGQYLLTKAENSAGKIRTIEYLALLLIVLLSILVLFELQKIIKYEKRLIAARDQAIAVAQEKSRFLAYMSHEIRTPLTMVAGFSEQMQHTSLDQKQTEYLNYIGSSCDLLLSTVNDILDFSKLEAGKFHLDSKPFNPKRLIEETTHSFEMKAKEKGLNISFSFNGDANQWISGDSFRIKQVLNNLVSNAIKNTDKGNVTIKGEMSRKSDNNADLNISVIDSGIGIPKSQLNDIFAEYSQVTQTADQRWKLGTGLGLPICKKIIQQMDGNIGVESEQSKGSTFFVNLTLPMTASPERNENLMEEDLLKKGSFRGMRILVAEDNLIGRKLLSAMLKDSEAVIIMKGDGQEAWEELQNSHFDLIISDVFMPVMNGLDLVKNIRKHADKRISSIPFVFLTADTLPEEVANYKAAGADALIFKPYHQIDLWRVIKQYSKQS